MRRLLLMLLLPLLACESTPVREEGDGSEITIPEDDLEPMARFLLDTQRLLVGEWIRIEVTPQFFEARMALTRDYRFVERGDHRLEDGTRVITLRNVNSVQVTNIDPALLPRVTFGNGLELRAYNEIRIFMRRPKSRDNPLFLRIQVHSTEGKSNMWVAGRLETEQPTIRIMSELLWDEDRERFVHKAGVG